MRAPASGIPSDEELIDAVSRQADGASLSDLAAEFGGRLAQRTLQRRLAALVESNRLRRDGARRWARYRLPAAAPAPSDPSNPDDSLFSAIARESLRKLERPLSDRAPVRYRAAYLDAYVPGETAWLGREERARLRELGTVADTAQPVGTYARRIADRLLIDLSWNSSRLEGNTYSLLDTRRLLELGVEAEGRDPREARMIRNHRDAIEFLIDNVEETGFDRLTVTNLHALLASELLPDPASPGRLRHIPVGIGGSTYRPCNSPQLIEAGFDALLARLDRTADPFEQSLVALAQLPYLQPFDDVNKRVSRLLANLPLIRNNLVPISFVGVPQALYTKALLAVYELEDHRPLRDLFVLAYERSVEHYREVRQTLGEPDPFRLRHFDRIAELIGEAVRGGLRLEEAATVTAGWAEEHAEKAERVRFREMAEAELLGLNESNFARFRLRPSEFRRWRTMQDGKGNSSPLERPVRARGRARRRGEVDGAER